MGDFFRTFWGTLSTRFVSLLNKIRMLFSVDWWRTQGFAKMREFFSALFDFKPRHKDDYFSVFRWMVSRKLAFAVVLIVGILSLYFIFVLSPRRPLDTDIGANINPVYRHNSLALRFVRGEVRIRAAAGHIAFEGNVDRGRVQGFGRLFSPAGQLIYEGEFYRNMYNGTGRLFHANGNVRYEGEFTDNLFHGSGRYFRPGGTIEFDGEFLWGERDGFGTLFNPAGQRVFSGNFRRGQLLYSELVGRSTAEFAEIYTGARTVFSFGDEFAVVLHDIDMVYFVDGGQNNLDSDWIVRAIIVAGDTITIGNDVFTHINELIAFFGPPDYHGELWINIGEAAAINHIGSPQIAPLVEMSARAVFDDFIEIHDFDMDYRLYIFSFRADGLLYTFYSTVAGAGAFFMYSITGD